MAAEMIERGIEAGDIRKIAPLRTARALIGMNLATFFEQVVGVPEPDVDSTVEMLLAVWVRTLYLAPPDEVSGAVSG